MVSNLALFCLATVLATFQKIGQFFYKSSGHPVLWPKENKILFFFHVFVLFVYALSWIQTPDLMIPCLFLS